MTEFASIVARSLVSIATMAAFVVALSAMFSAVGHLLLKPIHSPTADDESVAIVAGLAAFIVTAWYVYAWYSPLYPVIVAMLACGAVAVVFVSLQWAIQGNRTRERWQGALRRRWKWLVPLASIAALLTGVRLLNGGTTANFVGFGGNHDLYNWALAADEILGQAKFANIEPVGQATWTWLRPSVFGTSVLLALCAVLSGKTALAATPVLTVLLWSWFALFAMRCARAVFRLSAAESAMVGLLVALNGLFVFILVNAFYGQAFATVVCLVAANFLATSVLGKPIRAWRLGLLLVPCAALFLIVYVPGYGFLALAAGFAMFLTLGQTGPVNRKEIPGNVIYLAIACLTALAVTAPLLALPALLVPQYAASWVAWIRDAASATVAGILPLLHPSLLFSVPSPVEIMGSGARIRNYAVAFGILAAVAAWVWSRTKTAFPGFARLLLAGAAFHAILVGVYLFLFYFLGPRYQVWKLASYGALTFSFVPACIAVVALTRTGWRIPPRWGAGVSRVSGWTPWAVMLAAAVLSTRYWIAHQPNANLDAEIAAFTAVQKQAAPGTSIVFDLSFGQTLMAENILSKEHRLYPMGKSYFEELKPERIDFSAPDLLALTQARCVSLGQYSELNEKLDRDIANPESKFALIRPSESRAFVHAFFPGCPQLSKAQLVATHGLSGAESWGTWTDGAEAGFTFSLPQEWRGTSLVVRLRANPFRSAAIPAQRVNTLVNGVLRGSQSVKGPVLFSWTVPALETKTGRLVLTLQLPDARQPAPTEPDARHLGLALQFLTIAPVRE